MSDGVRKKLLMRMRRERAKQGYSDDTANGSSNTYAVERWHMLAAALIVG